MQRNIFILFLTFTYTLNLYSCDKIKQALRFPKEVKKLHCINICKQFQQTQNNQKRIKLFKQLLQLSTQDNLEIKNRAKKALGINILTDADRNFAYLICKNILRTDGEKKSTAELFKIALETNANCMIYSFIMPNTRNLTEHLNNINRLLDSITDIRINNFAFNLVKSVVQLHEQRIFETKKFNLKIYNKNSCLLDEEDSDAEKEIKVTIAKLTKLEERQLREALLLLRGTIDNEWAH